MALNKSIIIFIPSVVKIPRVKAKQKTKNYYFIGGQRSGAGGRLWALRQLIPIETL